ncbi:pilus assembly protein [Sphingopyxis sp. BSN-002]|uniref:TadE/TadG family type IV pilus assembly protein n=1 Tax=Sphingopyxis sp. BSN-002 TaxID=2911495 RepID=UPI001EDA716D|nr:TadE/TadG family type IV pilus assembly protein [Sphingopyxis sp. BSN-002]UKK86209.1 pilus assembly protein [Sphingopyxis sp. BSN-002]
MRGTFISRLRAGTSKLIRDQGGNAMMLTAAMILPIVGFAGSGIDIGRAYMAKLRLQQACDAGALAGRRYMAGGVYTQAAKDEATKMFTANFSDHAYGSSSVTFNTVAAGTADVNGTATAHMPTTVMKVFAFKGFDLTVNCTAKLEISNADIMMVLDVTGSMDTINSGDSVSRIEALKAASVSFFDTLTTADLGDGRLRFGVVPYSGTVNVGSILYSANPAWIADKASTPSREGKFKDDWGTGTSSDGAVTGTTYPGNADSGSSWSAWGNVSLTQANCATPPSAAGGAATKSGSASSTQTSQVVDGSGNKVTKYSTTQDYTYKKYEYQWVKVSGTNRCQRRDRTYRYTETYPTTLTQPPIKVFDYFVWTQRDFDVVAGKNGTTSMSFTKTGAKGVDESFAWNGCIIERGTKPFTSTQTAPADAYDMNIDLVPTADRKTQWEMFLSDVAYSRSGTGDQTTGGSTSFGKSAAGGSDVAACPPAAMKLTTMTKNDRAGFVSYIGKLKAQGYTYHDAGMVWGARLLSPDGLFKSENLEAPNKRPIARHIVFMTDGEPTAPISNFSFQSQEQSTGRIGASSDAEAVKRHTNRFLQLCEAAKAKNITIWIVGFGTSITTALKTCATPGKTYSAANAAQLNENFQAIARQISKLRLSQ